MSAPLDRDEFVRWRSQADGAREAGVLASGGGRHDWACFLYEQAAQLAVKGLLHACALDAWGHDLVVLDSRARAHLGPAWPLNLAESAARLSRHYIPARYPDAHASGAPAEHYTPGDARQAHDDATVLLAAVDAAWNGLNEESS